MLALKLRTFPNPCLCASWDNDFSRTLVSRGTLFKRRTIVPFVVFFGHGNDILVDSLDFFKVLLIAFSPRSFTPSFQIILLNLVFCTPEPKVLASSWIFAFSFFGSRSQVFLSKIFFPDPGSPNDVASDP